MQLFPMIRKEGELGAYDMKIPSCANLPAHSLRRDPQVQKLSRANMGNGRTITYYFKGAEPTCCQESRFSC